MIVYVSVKLNPSDLVKVSDDQIQMAVESALAISLPHSYGKAEVVEIEREED